MTTAAPSRIKLQTHIYKGCRRCGGVLHLERDPGSTLAPDALEYVCLQCGGRAPVAAVIAQTRAVREESPA